MKRGDIVREETYGLGIVMEETEKAVKFITVNRENTTSIMKSDFNAKFVRNISQETRRLLKEKLSLFEKRNNYYHKIHEIEMEINQTNKNISNVSDRITKEMGYLTESEFIEAFIKCLPAYVRSMVNEYYSVSIDSYGNKTLEIEYTDRIEKYFREGSFVYEEYDGCMMMCSHAETDPNYQAYIKIHRKPLSVKTKIHECLSLGDKDWLIYHGRYCLGITEELTKDYAEKLAKKFVD